MENSGGVEPLDTSGETRANVDNGALVKLTLALSQIDAMDPTVNLDGDRRIVLPR
jgi:hypothetical protein